MSRILESGRRSSFNLSDEAAHRSRARVKILNLRVLKQIPDYFFDRPVTDEFAADHLAVFSITPQ